MDMSRGAGSGQRPASWLTQSRRAFRTAIHAEVFVRAFISKDRLSGLGRVVCRFFGWIIKRNFFLDDWQIGQFNGGKKNDVAKAIPMTTDDKKTALGESCLNPIRSISAKGKKRILD